MTDVLKYTTKEAAKKLGVSVPTFRIYVRIANVKAHEVVQTGKRGRPADLWTGLQVQNLAKLKGGN